MSSEREVAMASDTQSHSHLTYGDLCRAIAERRVAHTLRDRCYYVSVRDLRYLLDVRECDEAPDDVSPWRSLLATPEQPADLSEMGSAS